MQGEKVQKKRTKNPYNPYFHYLKTYEQEDDLP